jgi:hypothetical protein
MARIRSIKPDVWEDEKVAGMSDPARLVFMACWNYADDAGVLRGNPQWLTTRAYSFREPSRSPHDILQELVENRCLIPYEVNGQQYVVVRTFRKHQVTNKPTKPTLPPPPREIVAECPGLAAFYASFKISVPEDYGSTTVVLPEDYVPDARASDVGSGREVEGKGGGVAATVGEPETPPPPTAVYEDAPTASWASMTLKADVYKRMPPDPTPTELEWSQILAELARREEAGVLKGNAAAIAVKWLRERREIRNGHAPALHPDIANCQTGEPCD